MQDPLNFSRNPALSAVATQGMTSHFLNSLHGNHHNGTPGDSAASTPMAGFNDPLDFRASSLPPELVAQPPTSSSLPNSWASFHSNAILAAAAAAASMNSKCPRETHFEDLLLKAHSQFVLNVAVANHRAQQASHSAIPAIDIQTRLQSQPQQQQQQQEPNIYQQHQTSLTAKRALTGLQSRAISQVTNKRQATRQIDRSGENGGRRSRVVIHQFGDAEEHFSKALRNLHVKSTGDEEVNASQSQSAHQSDIGVRNFDSVGRPSNSTCKEAQNIADLAVEKHFEKSLATFHAKRAAAEAANSGHRQPSPSLPPSPSNKRPLDLSLSRQFFPNSSSSPSPNPSISDTTSTTSSSSSSSSCSPSPCGISFNPKKKWLAQYGGNDVACRSKEVSEKSCSWDVEEAPWRISKPVGETYGEKRARSCPLLLGETKLREVPKESDENPPSASYLHLPKSSLARTISLDAPCLGNSMELFGSGTFEEGEDVTGVSKSASTRETPASSPIATSSGFFTDSTYSLDSSTLPVISESGCFGSTASVLSRDYRARERAALRGGGVGQPSCLHSRSFGYEPGDSTPIDGVTQGRKRTASDTSSLASMKRSRSVAGSPPTPNHHHHQEFTTPRQPCN